MAGGVFYFTAGSRRDVVAVDAGTGETLWMYRLDEGERGDRAVRTQNRGLAYWTDGKSDSRILLISPGFHLIALNARTGVLVASFGKSGPGGRQRARVQDQRARLHSRLRCPHRKARLDLSHDPAPRRAGS